MYVCVRPPLFYLEAVLYCCNNITCSGRQEGLGSALEPSFSATHAKLRRTKPAGLKRPGGLSHSLEHFVRSIVSHASAGPTHKSTRLLDSWKSQHHCKLRAERKRSSEVATDWRKPLPDVRRSCTGTRNMHLKQATTSSKFTENKKGPGPPLSPQRARASSVDRSSQKLSRHRFDITRMEGHAAPEEQRAHRRLLRPMREDRATDKALRICRLATSALPS